MGKINVTKNYRLFQRSDKNRRTDLKRHKKLVESMQAYGFLQSFPIVCHRNGDKHLIVKDGQHRLEIAESLGLPIYYVEESVDFDIALVNCTPKVWVLKDYAENWAAHGLKSYREGLDFSEQHGIPLGVAFAMLAGTTSFGNVQPDFVAGKFTIKDREWADLVASIYGPIVAISSRLRTSTFLAACMAVCRVKGFSVKRMLESAERCRDKLVPYSTRDAYLDMLETVYNFGRKTLVPLKIDAMTAMKDRNACKKIAESAG